jgi:hypothetical protein
MCRAGSAFWRLEPKLAIRLVSTNRIEHELGGEKALALAVLPTV